jgi:hypothetical protein
MHRALMMAVAVAALGCSDADDPAAGGTPSPSADLVDCSTVGEVEAARTGRIARVTWAPCASSAPLRYRVTYTGAPERETWSTSTVLTGLAGVGEMTVVVVALAGDMESEVGRVTLPGPVLAPATTETAARVSRDPEAQP